MWYQPKALDSFFNSFDQLDKVLTKINSGKAKEFIKKIEKTFRAT